VPEIKTTPRIERVQLAADHAYDYFDEIGPRQRFWRQHARASLRGPYSGASRRLAQEHAVFNARRQALPENPKEFNYTQHNSSAPHLPFWEPVTTCPEQSAWAGFRCRMFTEYACATVQATRNVANFYAGAFRNSTIDVIRYLDPDRAETMEPGIAADYGMSISLDFGAFLPQSIRDIASEVTGRIATEFTGEGVGVEDQAFASMDLVLDTDSRTYFDEVAQFILGTETDSPRPTTLLGYIISYLSCQYQWDVEASRNFRLFSGIGMTLLVTAIIVFIGGQLGGQVGTMLTTWIVVLLPFNALFATYNYSPACYVLPTLKPLAIKLPVIPPLLPNGLGPLPPILPNGLDTNEYIPYAMRRDGKLRLNFIFAPPALLDDFTDMVATDILTEHAPWWPDGLITERETVVNDDGRWSADLATKITQCRATFFPDATYNLAFVLNWLVPRIYEVWIGTGGLPYSTLGVDMQARFDQFPPREEATSLEIFCFLWTAGQMVYETLITSLALTFAAAFTVSFILFLVFLAATLASAFLIVIATIVDLFILQEDFEKKKK